MELFGHTKDVIRANYFYLMERMCPSKISDAHDIPIIINNYNRLTMLKKLIDSLTSRGYTNIVILDNQSAYPPLLEWYAKCQFEVIRLPKTTDLRHCGNTLRCGSVFAPTITSTPTPMCNSPPNVLPTWWSACSIS